MKTINGNISDADYAKAKAMHNQGHKARRVATELGISETMAQALFEEFAEDFVSESGNAIDTAEQAAPKAMAELVNLALYSDNERTKLVAIKEILDRAHGKAKENITHNQPDVANLADSLVLQRYNFKIRDDDDDRKATEEN